VVKRSSVLPKALACGLLICTAFPAGRGVAAQELTLDDYFAAAVRRSEVIATQSELIRQAEERYKQATAALLPTISGYGSYLWQDPLPTGAPSTPSNLSRQPLAKVTATQPLFRGFREIAAMRQTEALISAQSDDYQNARVLLFKDVVQNYYNVLAIERDIFNLGEEIRLNHEREKEIQARVRIGRSRVSELLNVQSTISTLRAQIEQLRGQLSVAREVFAFLSGLAADTPLRDSETLPAGVDPIENYLAGVDSRPDVRATRQRITAADENLTVARGGHLPSLDLNGNYYFDRPGYLSDSNWDVQLALTIPIYAGGSVQSKVREAASQRTQAELAMSQVTRAAEQEIRALYQSVVLNITQLEALENSTDAAKKSYEAQSAEYRLGLVINLDVLQALTAFQTNQRALDRARLTAKADYQRLLAASARRAGITSAATPSP
jgi:outer membrane protein